MSWGATWGWDGVTVITLMRVVRTRATVPSPGSDAPTAAAFTKSRSSPTWSRLLPLVPRQRLSLPLLPRPRAPRRLPAARSFISRGPAIKKSGAIAAISRPRKAVDVALVFLAHPYSMT